MSLDSQNGTNDQNQNPPANQPDPPAGENPQQSQQGQEGAAPPKPDKAEQARINGAKSRGPVTPEGKARSSQNAFKHSYSSKTVVLNNENVASFQALRDSYIRDFSPQTAVELDIVEILAGISWKIKQVWSDQVALVDREMDLQKEAELKNLPIDEATRSGFAIESLDKKGTTLTNLRRYEAQLERSLARNTKLLFEIQQNRRKNAPEQNEPIEILPEEQTDQLKADELTPRTAYPTKSSDPTKPQTLCRDCDIIIRALMPFVDAQNAVRTALKTAKEQGLR